MNRIISLCLTLIAVGLAGTTFAGSSTNEKKSHFERFKSGTANLFNQAKTKASDTVSSCGTNCANGKQTLSTLAGCAFTHPRVPKCMRALQQELEDYKKNYPTHKKPQDADANLDPFAHSYFDLMPLSSAMLLQMATQRIDKEQDKSFAKNLTVLTHLFKSVIKQTFFEQDSNKYEMMQKSLAQHKYADQSYVGYIFHVDSFKAQKKGKQRMAHGMILHSPSKKENLTGLVFEIPRDSIDGVEDPKGSFFSSLSGIQPTSKKSFKYGLKSKLGITKYEVPVAVSVSAMRVLDDKPPAPRRNSSLSTASTDGGSVPPPRPAAPKPKQD